VSRYSTAVSETTKSSVFVVSSPLALVPVIDMFSVSSTVGVPDISPVLSLILRPVGKSPLTV